MYNFRILGMCLPAHFETFQPYITIYIVGNYALMGVNAAWAQSYPIAPPRTRCALWDHMAAHPNYSL